MPDPPPPVDQFWLLTGEVPAGPFTVPQVHAELAAGRATWQTPACPVGGTTWLPLLKTPGLGPAAAGPPAGPAQAEVAGVVAADRPPVPAAASEAFPPSPPAPPGRSAERPTRGQPAEWVGVATGLGVLAILLGLAGAAVYGVYEWVRPLTPTEVCRRADRAKTAAEAKKYATPRTHPLIDAMFADKSALDPNDASEWTGEADGPRPDTRLVGFRGTTFLPEAGRRVRVEGHVVMVKSDGWKADDFVITGVEGAALPGPVSLVDEHARAGSAGGVARTTPAAGARPPTVPTGTPRIKSRYEQIFDRVKDAIGWGGIVAIGVVVVLVLAAREGAKQKGRTS